MVSRNSTIWLIIGISIRVGIHSFSPQFVRETRDIADVLLCSFDSLISLTERLTDELPPPTLAEELLLLNGHKRKRRGRQHTIVHD